MGLFVPGFPMFASSRDPDPLGVGLINPGRLQVGRVGSSSRAQCLTGSPSSGQGLEGCGFCHDPGRDRGTHRLQGGVREIGWEGANRWGVLITCGLNYATQVVL